jgi:hypothetical protein
MVGIDLLPDRDNQRCRTGIEKMPLNYVRRQLHCALGRAPSLKGAPDELVGVLKPGNRRFTHAEIHAKIQRCWRFGERATPSDASVASGVAALLNLIIIIPDIGKNLSNAFADRPVAKFAFELRRRK